MNRRDLMRMLIAGAGAVGAGTTNLSNVMALYPKPDTPPNWWENIKRPNDWKFRVWTRPHLDVVPRKFGVDAHVVFRHIYHGKEEHGNPEDIRVFIEYTGDKIFVANSFIDRLLDEKVGPGRIYICDTGPWGVAMLYCDMTAGYYPVRENPWWVMDRAHEILDVGFTQKAKEYPDLYNV